jgi:hypothetical protein
MCTPCIPNYYLCDFFKIIDNKKIKKGDGTNDDVHIMHVKRYAIRNFSEL